MPTVDVVNLSKEKVGTVDLDERLFAAEINKPLIHEAVVMQQACMRQGTAATKTRGMVSGGGKKPWRQKGTGRARSGSTRSPIWRGGGTIFGPNPRDYGYAFTYLEIPEFVAEMNRRATRDDPIYPLLDFFNRSHSKIAAMQQKRYDNSGYRQARNGRRGGRPDPSLTETVAHLMRFMLGEGLIPPRPNGLAPDLAVARAAPVHASRRNPA